MNSQERQQQIIELKNKVSQDIKKLRELLDADQTLKRNTLIFILHGPLVGIGDDSEAVFHGTRGDLITVSASLATLASL